MEIDLNFGVSAAIAGGKMREEVTSSLRGPHFMERPTATGPSIWSANTDRLATHRITLFVGLTNYNFERVMGNIDTKTPDLANHAYLPTQLALCTYVSDSPIAPTPSSQQIATLIKWS